MNIIRTIEANSCKPIKHMATSTSFGLLILPGFPMEAYSLFASVVEFMNLEHNCNVFDCVSLSEHGGMIRGSCGASIETMRISECKNELDYILVLSSSEQRFENKSKAASFIGRHVRSKSTVGAIGGGVFALADIGHLENRTVSVHWRHQDIFSELFSNVKISDKMFKVDEKVWTSCGRTAALDLAIHVVNTHFGQTCAVEIAQEFNHSRLYDDDATQFNGILNMPMTGSRVVNEAIRLFREHLEEVIGIDDVSESVNISKRQLERQFIRHCGLPPNQYYRNMRLSRAREMIKSTNFSVTEIAHATGFSGASSLAVAYRRRYEITPNVERKKSVIH